MSLFQTIDSPCPACKAPVSCEIVHSVNADRRPDLRDAILDRSFQMQTCTACGQPFRMEPEFTYLHIANRQFITVWPASRLPEWVELEKRGEQSFNIVYGPDTSPIAAEIGHELKRRTVFGWEAMHEKLVADANEIDDVTLELAKIAIQRWTDGPGPDDDTELRLLGVTPEQLMIFGVLKNGTEELLDHLSAPKDLITEIESQADAWQVLRDRLSEGTFVDMQRLVVETV